jgi:hypothetical protein
MLATTWRGSKSDREHIFRLGGRKSVATIPVRAAAERSSKSAVALEQHAPAVTASHDFAFSINRQKRKLFALLLRK